MHDSPPTQHDPERFPTAIPFVGRERELALLRHALDRALAGHGSVVLLNGEPGIGKTRTAEEFAVSAKTLGCQVHWSACDEWDGAPAYWPWVQAVRSIIRGQDAAALSRLLGSGGPDVAQIVPELRAQHAPPISQPAGNEEAARFRLFDGVSAFLIEVTRETPVVVVLDDLHWADTPSLLLLQFIARHLRDAPLLILGTYRSAEVGSGHPLAEALGELTRIPGNTRIVLSGLTRGETSAVTTAVAGHELPARIVDVVQHETEGNPFFVTEIARFLTAERETTLGASRGNLHFHVPETVKEVIGQRLRRLPAECQALLSIASVIGREFSLRLLAAVSAQPVEAVLTQLDDALQARLIDAGATLSAYRFHHALVQDTLYDMLPPSQRTRLHRQVGQTLETRNVPGADPPLDELSYHFFQAAPLGDSGKALAYATQAAERAMRLLAWENAVEHYERALQVFDLTPEASTIRKCDLLLALGDAQTLAERSNRGSPAAREAFLRAAELAQVAGSGDHLARATLGFAGRNLMATPSGSEQVALLEKALARLGTDDSILRARVMARLAIDRDETDIPNNPRHRLDPSSRVRRLSDEAVAVARRIGDPATLAFALLAKRNVCATHDNLDERMALATEAVTLAEAAQDMELAWWGSLLLFWDLAEAGDLERERRAFEMHLEQSRQAPTPFKAWGDNCHRAHYALREGNYAAAEESFLLGISGLPLIYSPYPLLYLRREQGRLHEIAATIEHLIDVRSVWKTRLALRVLLAVELGRDDAGALFDEMAARDFADVPVTERWLNVLVVLAEACVSLGDRPRAQIQLLYDLLLPYADRLLAVLVEYTHLGAVSRPLGMLAMLLGRWDDAEQHFAHALALNERMGLRPLAAHTRHAWADMLVRRGDARDIVRARELNGQALAAAREIGMVRLERMVEALDARLIVDATAGPDPTVATSGLTGRELEVLRLIGSGKNNRDIAEDLFLSVRTVERHVENLYRKLDVNSRAEAIAFALRRLDR